MLSCSKSDTDTSSPKKAFSVELEEVMTLEEIEDNEESYLVRPGKLVVDNSDNVYLIENQRQVILKYSSEGKFLKTISGPGRGPGEMASARTFFADSVLLVHNAGNQVVNKFSLEGELLSSYNIQGVNSSTEIIRDGDGYLLFDAAFVSSVEPGTILQRYDKDFNMTGEGQISQGIFFDEYTREQADLIKGAFQSVIMISEDAFVMTLERAYPGKLFQFRRIESGQTWELERVIPGKEVLQPYKVVSQEEGGELVTFSEGRIYAYKLLSKSMGLYKFDDDYYVHFIRLSEEDRYEYGVELYNSDFEYIGYDAFAADEDITDDKPLILTYVRAQDSQGRFYGVRYDENGVTVSANELKITWEDN